MATATSKGGVVASSSSAITVRLRPRRPPAVLICSTANVAPWRNAVPGFVFRSTETPILMGSLGCEVGVGVSIVEDVGCNVGVVVKVGVDEECGGVGVDKEVGVVSGVGATEGAFVWIVSK